MNNLVFSYVIGYRDKFVCYEKWSKQFNLVRKKKLIKENKS